MYTDNTEQIPFFNIPEVDGLASAPETPRTDKEKKPDPVLKARFAVSIVRSLGGERQVTLFRNEYENSKRKSYSIESLLVFSFLINDLSEFPKQIRKDEDAIARFEELLQKEFQPITTRDGTTVPSYHKLL